MDEYEENNLQSNLQIEADVTSTPSQVEKIKNNSTSSLHDERTKGRKDESTSENNREDNNVILEQPPPYTKPNSSCETSFLLLHDVNNAPVNTPENNQDDHKVITQQPPSYQESMNETSFTSPYETNNAVKYTTSNNRVYFPVNTSEDNAGNNNIIVQQPSRNNKVHGTSVGNHGFSEFTLGDVTSHDPLNEHCCVCCQNTLCDHECCNHIFDTIGWPCRLVSRLFFDNCDEGHFIKDSCCCCSDCDNSHNVMSSLCCCCDSDICNIDDCCCCCCDGDCGDCGD